MFRGSDSTAIVTRKSVIHGFGMTDIMSPRLFA